MNQAGRSAVSSTMSPAPIFVDRDGTLIEEAHYPRVLSQLKLVPGAAKAVATANAAGHPVVVVSNQSGVARGYFDEAFIARSAAYLQELLAAAGAHLDGHYHCPYHPDGLPPYNREHPDRKPGAGMLLRAAADLQLSLSGAYMVGDKLSDVLTGAEHGVIPVLVRTGEGRASEARLPADFQQRGGHVAEHLPAALAWILERSAAGRA